jgi:biotin transport system substrate-specific component
MTARHAVLPALGIRSSALLVVGASLFLALSAQIAFPLPFSPVPVTAQSFAVLLTGALLGSRRGAAAVALYLAEGAAGLPFFAGGSGGPAFLLGPTGGYLLAFVPAAWVAGALAERGWDRRTFSALAAMSAGNAILLLGGVAWLARLSDVPTALRLGLFPFLPGDVLKVALAALALPAGRRIADRVRGPRV